MPPCLPVSLVFSGVFDRQALACSAKWAKRIGLRTTALRVSLLLMCIFLSCTSLDPTLVCLPARPYEAAVF
jgi:hypothetical protein